MAASEPTPITPANDILDAEGFVHYYDQHPTVEDLMGESTIQFKLITYLVQVLEWLYRVESWFVVSNLNMYRFKQRYEYPLAPDLAVFKGVVITNPADRTLRSWRLYEPGRPPPQVVFEICSDSTWRDDVTAKPAKYATLGVQEYFAYDPNEPPYFSEATGRLRGWRLIDGTMVELPTDDQGRLWSVELESYLVPDGSHLRLHTSDGRLRLTRAEAAEAKLRELGIDPTTL